ncbi:uncharacterized protein TNCV_3276061 [Trichonephila clavipes]|nr:uncharacterized protein TNCV_3276061 [Trichonephila clavipes]
MAKKSSVLWQERRQTGGGEVPKVELTDFEMRTSIPQYINCFVDCPVTPSKNTDKITEYDSSSDPSNAVMDMNDLKPTPKIARPLKETLAMFRKRAKTPTAGVRNGSFGLSSVQNLASKRNARGKKDELDERKRKEERELAERKRKEGIELAERKRKEEMELAERKRKEEMELAERKRKEMEVAERKRRAGFEQRMRDVEMEFETQKKVIELEGEGHFTRACLDIEVSTDRGNIGNEVRSNLSSETRFKVEMEDRLKADEEAKAVEEGRKMEEERRMNERIALEGEMRLKRERWLVEEQMRHIQEKRKTSMKEEQKWLPEERCKRMNEQNQLLNEEQKKLSDEDVEVPQAIEKVLVSKGEQVQTHSADQYAVAQSVVVEKEKEEISVDVIKDKDDINPVILSKERMDFVEDEIEEEKPKLPKRKRRNLSRMTVAELQQK